MQDLVNNWFYHILVCICLSLCCLPTSAATLIAKLRLGPTPVAPGLNALTHRLYVPDEFDNMVYVVDTTTNSLQTSVNVLPGNPCCMVGHLAVNPATNLIYVMTGYINIPSTVYVINGADNSILTSIPIGDGGAGGSGIAANSVTNRIYACAAVDGTVSVIDGNSNTVVDTITPPKNAEWVAVDESTNLVYVVSENGRPSASTLYVYDGATDTLIHVLTLPGGQSAQANGVAVDSSLQRAYIADSGTGILDVIDTTTFTIVGDVRGVHSPEIPAVDPVAHTVLVANTPDNIHSSVAVIDPIALQITGHIGTKGYATGIAVDPQTEDIYLTVNGLVVFAP